MNNKVRSRKGFTLVEIMIVVVIIGLLAAMAIPAFKQVREEAQEKAIINNLRQIAAAGQQYILENGVSSANWTNLVNVYFKTIKAVAGENYKTLTVSDSGGTLSVTTTGGTTISYSY